MKTLPLRLEKRILRTKTCWNWIGSLNVYGYGRLWQKHLDSTAYAHRIVYEFLVGPIPKRVND